ncbi:uncharacterized protein LOC134685135 [Mytilus trossulus]|uniref:uncharacterized protein LOC134685135 n=1 Tax=Mytilus trossulus TaxID=6551 RepID=UPI00300702C9
MFKATEKPTKPGKTPLNYNKEAEHHKLDTTFYQLDILPEEEELVVKHQFEHKLPEREDTTIPFVQDPWTLPPQYSCDQPTGPVLVYNPFIPSIVSTTIRTLQPTSLVRPKIPQALLTISAGTRTPGPVQPPYLGTPLAVNKLSLPVFTDTVSFFIQHCNGINRSYDSINNRIYYSSFNDICTTKNNNINRNSSYFSRLPEVKLGGSIWISRADIDIGPEG